MQEFISTSQPVKENWAFESYIDFPGRTEIKCTNSSTHMPFMTIEKFLTNLTVLRRYYTVSLGL